MQKQSENQLQGKTAERVEDRLSASPASSTDGDDSPIGNTPKKGKRNKVVFTAAIAGILLVAIAAAGYFLVIKPQLATVRAIESIIDTELSSDVISAGVNCTVWSKALQTLGQSENEYIVDVSIPNYQILSTKEVMEKADIPEFDLSIDEASYLRQFDACIRIAAMQLLKTVPDGYTDRELTIQTHRQDNGIYAAMDVGELAAIWSERDQAFERMADEVYGALPQSKQYLIAAQEYELLKSAFHDVYTAANCTLNDVLANVDGTYSLALTLPLPDRIGEYCVQLDTASDVQEVEIAVTMNATGTSAGVSQSEQERAVDALQAYDFALGEQLEASGEVKAASVLYALGGDYKRAVETYDWSESLQLSQTNVVALKLDGTVLFDGGFETDSPYDAQSAYQSFVMSETPDLSGWTDIAAIRTSSFNLVGLKEDGTVLFAGNLWQQDPDHNSTKSARWETPYQPDLNGWSDIVAVQNSRYIVAGLKSDGTVLSVGLRNDGSLKRAPVDTSDWTDIVKLYVFNDQIFGVRSDGTVVSDGMHYDPETKKYTAYDFSDWTEITDLSIALSYSSDSYLIVGLCRDGTVVTNEKEGWVYYTEDETGTHGSRELGISDWSNITKVICNRCFVIGLKEDDSLAAFGGFVQPNENINPGDISVSQYLFPLAIDMSEQHDVVAMQENIGYEGFFGNYGFILMLDGNGTVYIIGTMSSGFFGITVSADWRNMLAASVSQEELPWGFFFRTGYGLLGLDVSGRVRSTGSLILSVYDPIKTGNYVYWDERYIDVAGWELW